jgi:hypothetical protein
MSICPSCRRPVAVARDRCLYCGEALPAHLVPGPPSPGPLLSGGTATLGPADPTRTLVVLDLDSADAQQVEKALGLAPYESELLARRGGFHLHRVLPRELAETEVRRLRTFGLTVEAVAEAETREQPLRAVGGERGGGIFAFRTEEGRVAVHREDLLIVVRGAISRQYQPVYRRRRVDTASLEEGYRVHLHRRSDLRPDSSSMPGWPRLETE